MSFHDLPEYQSPLGYDEAIRKCAHLLADFEDGAERSEDELRIEAEAISSLMSAVFGRDPRQVDQDICDAASLMGMM